MSQSQPTMPRPSPLTALDTEIEPAAPKLVITNSSKSLNRYPLMVRMRPSLLKRSRRLTVGPLYLLIEHALAKLLDELEAAPASQVVVLNAAHMEPDDEDRRLLAILPQPRGSGESNEGPSKAKASESAMKKSSPGTARSRTRRT